MICNKAFKVQHHVFNLSFPCKFTVQIDKTRVEVQQLHECDVKRDVGSSVMKINLDIPESVGLAASTPMFSSSRLIDLDSVRRGKRKI